MSTHGTLHTLFITHLDSYLRGEPQVFRKHIVELHGLVKAGICCASLVRRFSLASHEAHLYLHFVYCCTAPVCYFPVIGCRLFIIFFENIFVAYNTDHFCC